MRFSNRTKLKLFALLILLNIILRYNLTRHEFGIDTFEMHLLANSVTEFGEARWWVNPTSIVGMHPNSYCSAISFIISGISQCSGTDTDLPVFIYSSIFGIFAIFGSYTLAGIIRDDDFFKFLVAFGFSTAPGILVNTTWTMNARSPFLILLPVFLYTLYKFRKHPLKYGAITIIITLLLWATHHYIYYLIPLFVAYFTLTLVYKLIDHIKFIKIPEKLMIVLIISGFCLMLAYPFMTHKFMSVGSRWSNIGFMFTEYPRYIGIPVFFSLGGFVYLLFKSNKRFEEWALLVMLMFLSVFAFEERYMKWFVIIFAILLAGVGFMNLKRLSGNKSTYATTAIIIFLLLSVSFSGYFQFLRYYPFKTVDENMYITALWTKGKVEGVGICNDRWGTWKISSISTLPFLAGSETADQAYGLVDVSDFELVKRSITSEKFWMSSPYKKVKGTSSDGYWHYIMDGYYARKGYMYISAFNITYLIEDVGLQRRWISHHGCRSSSFIEATHNTKNCIYNSGELMIWDLK